MRYLFMFVVILLPFLMEGNDINNHKRWYKPQLPRPLQHTDEYLQYSHGDSSYSDFRENIVYNYPERQFEPLDKYYFVYHHYHI